MKKKRKFFSYFALTKLPFNDKYMPFFFSWKQILEFPAEFSFFFAERFSFLGTRILEKVIEELMRKGLADAKRLLLAGSRSVNIIFDHFDCCY